MASRGWRILKDVVTCKQVDCDLSRPGIPSLLSRLPDATSSSQPANASTSEPLERGHPTRTAESSILAGFSHGSYRNIEHHRRERFVTPWQEAERQGFAHTRIGSFGRDTCPHVSSISHRAVQGSATAAQSVPSAKHEIHRHQGDDNENEGECSQEISHHQCWSCGAARTGHVHRHRLSNPSAASRQASPHSDTAAEAIPNDTPEGGGSSSGGDSWSARLPPAVRNRFVCSSCGALQPADASVSYFDIFGL